MGTQRRGADDRFVEEPARSTPVYGSCDVLVVGGGPAGTAAAVAAGRLGADTVLVERYNHLGGLSTGGLVSWIDRMTDWDGNLVVAGIGAELVDRCGPDACIGPRAEIWGSRNPVEAAYWRVRTAALRETVHWSPTVDPEVLKLVTNDIVRESHVHTLLHCWVVATIVRDGSVGGVVFESKQGRFALTAPVVIDCTGDGDVFAQAGAGFDDDFDGESAHARLTTSFRFGNVDMRRYLDFRMLHQSEFSETMQRAAREGISLLAHATPYDSVALFLTPKMAGYSALDVADLTEVEFVSRDVARKGLAFFRENVPGFERAWILDTASQVGTRHARRLAGAERITIEHWRDDGSYPDSIGLCPGMTPSFPTLQIPYRSLVPASVNGLLAAGRNLSADTKSHAALREIPECWAMGEAAGVAAVMAVDKDVEVRDLNIDALQARLVEQGAIVHRPTQPDRSDGQHGAEVGLEESIHWQAVHESRAFD
ncbi:MAG TPA: FAD-dependent oxidoreductase [Acidimicrobiales bacterium]|nr:FAD-dependent oxidoreductase [Acidimicrobiales bacterium]